MIGLFRKWRGKKNRAKALKQMNAVLGGKAFFEIGPGVKPGFIVMSTKDDDGCWGDCTLTVSDAQKISAALMDELWADGNRVELQEGVLSDE